MNNENVNLVLMQQEMKSKLVAWLLAYFLGVFGGHCFYIRKKGLGWAILLTFCSILLVPIALLLIIYSLFLINKSIEMHNRKVAIKYTIKDNKNERIK